MGTISRDVFLSLTSARGKVLPKSALMAGGTRILGGGVRGSQKLTNAATNRLGSSTLLALSSYECNTTDYSFLCRKKSFAHYAGTRGDQLYQIDMTAHNHCRMKARRRDEMKAVIFAPYVVGEAGQRKRARGPNSAGMPLSEWSGGLSQSWSDLLQDDLATPRARGLTTHSTQPL
ncbi:hypothetical protein J6590_049232 [Homalodisca vitripennis]|nr:hypothetical protein J6590_049232 [Homalodisca vitripennis]